MSARIEAEWIAVDWGTTNLRAWAMGAGGETLALASSDEGMGRLNRAGYEPALLRLIQTWLAPSRATPVVVCGMAGSRQGWIEAPYRPVPCAPVDGQGLTPVPTADPRLSVHIIPGLCQRDPADVMRGEETQIAGFMAETPGFEGVLCLPGTHTKWVRLKAGRVTAFQTFLTGELFSLLSRHSVLSHLMAGEGWDQQAFETALDAALAAPERTSASLFSLRAEALLEGLAPAAARARLSATLIGAELAAARPFWQDQALAVVGAAAVARAYASALTGQGRPVLTTSGDSAALAGLAMARALMKETT
ncbi:2-dehydro-3-deoxygalactonokinase [Solirhodobacter olei]|uniref:2-dehydro-3-deoxygalactonokinase n=1 Tax=Solirhodobacter olei TaxID=2493082 RepID=UPI000FDBBA6D|nr:2-dehydro-3-deoxygalactonokinase [Solirhodobacter olei]